MQSAWHVKDQYELLSEMIWDEVPGGIPYCFVLLQLLREELALIFSLDIYHTLTQLDLSFQERNDTCSGMDLKIFLHFLIFACKLYSYLSL